MTDSTAKTIHCAKLDQLAPALTRPPLPGPLGKRIMAEISLPAWEEWKKRQTMFINEYRLNLTDPKARLFLQDQMEAFLFSDDDTLPDGFSAE